jgi:hypothetical protein
MDSSDSAPSPPGFELLVVSEQLGFTIDPP